MIVTCDKCKTKYNVKDDLIGKKIRCVRCGYVWTFSNDVFGSFMSKSVESEENIVPKNQDPLKTNDAFSVPQDSNEQVSNDILSELRKELTSDLPNDEPPQDDKNVFDFGNKPQSQENVDALFDTSPQENSEPKSQSEVDSMFDSSNIEVKNDVDLSGINDLNQNPVLTETLSGMENTEKEFKVEDVFDKDNENQNQASAESIVEQISQNNSENIKMVVSQFPPSKKGFSFFGFLFITVLTMLIFMSVSVWFLRFELAKELPVVISYYEKIGIDVLPVGTGLDFKDIVKEKTVENGVEYLWVKGKIVNISEKGRKIPSIMLVLFDVNHIMLDSRIFSFNNKILEAGASEDFTIWVESPSKNALEAELTFTKERQR